VRRRVPLRPVQLPVERVEAGARADHLALLPFLPAFALLVASSPPRPLCARLCASLAHLAAIVAVADLAARLRRLALRLASPRPRARLRRAFSTTASLSPSRSKCPSFSQSLFPCQRAAWRARATLVPRASRGRPGPRSPPPRPYPDLRLLLSQRRCQRSPRPRPRRPDRRVGEVLCVVSSPLPPALSLLDSGVSLTRTRPAHSQGAPHVVAAGRPRRGRQGNHDQGARG